MASSLRQVLVHLDATSKVADRLAIARQIAEQQGAALSALYAATPAFVELPYAPELGPTLAADLVALDEERRANALRIFDKAMASPGPVATWSQINEEPVVGAFAQQSLFADLLVLGQHDGGDPASRAVPPDFAEAVLMASGRPAVLVPFVGWTGTVGETVAIAWKETPEAAHAVSAALPFLRRAAQVHVLTWGEEGGATIGGKQLDLDGYLKLHEVVATWHRGGPEPGNVGELLLSRVCDLSADLLVMGCYGHSRAREWVLGGASRAVLQSMTIPVLMAH
jgi:nucleotide-binding universal stress UspA family protein